MHSVDINLNYDQGFNAHDLRTNGKTNRGHLVIMTNVPTMFETCGIKHSIDIYQK